MGLVTRPRRMPSDVQIRKGQRRTEGRMNPAVTRNRPVTSKTNADVEGVNQTLRYEPNATNTAPTTSPKRRIVSFVGSDLTVLIKLKLPRKTMHLHLLLTGFCDDVVLDCQKVYARAHKTTICVLRCADYRFAANVE